MIYKKDYDFRLSELLEVKTIGKFSITKQVVPKGSEVRTYWPGGFYYVDKTRGDIPVVKLKEGYTFWMSDSPMEQAALAIPAILAYGDVLIIGLGIGLYPLLLRKNKDVKSITIVEKSQEIVDLVYDKIKTAKTSIKVIDGETFLGVTDNRYDFIYIDVWACIMAPIKEIDGWTNRAKRCLKLGGEVRCWLQELYDRVKDKLPKEPTPQTGLPGLLAPCLICGKRARFDYAGLCKDCADILEVSELYMGGKQ